jgi:stress-induced morphogen
MEKIQALSYLLEEIYPHKLFIEDNSEIHSSHFKTNANFVFPSHVSITIVSGEFNDMPLIARQRLVNKALAPAYNEGLHSAVIKAYTLDEYKEMELRKLEKSYNSN